VSAIPKMVTELVHRKNARIDELEREITRLKAIEAAARRFVTAEPCWLDETAVHMYLRGIPCECCEAGAALRKLLGCED
jgi:hypothetical protein